MKERDRLENRYVDGMIILKRIFKKLEGDTHLSNIVQDRGRWRLLVNAVINFRVP